MLANHTIQRKVIAEVNCTAALGNRDRMQLLFLSSSLAIFLEGSAAGFFPVSLGMTQMMMMRTRRTI